MTKADIVIIGSGPGGYETAAEAAAKGADVVLIERGELGGTCLNRGCIPTKALCRNAEVARLVKNASVFGINAADVTLDYARAVSRKNDIVTGLREGIAAELSKVRVVKADAAFTSAHTVKAGNEEFTADKIIIATGSRPASLPVPGAELAVNSDFILEMTELPDSLIIIGGGVIGMEFAEIFSAFGVRVTVLEYCPEILPTFDEEIAKRLRTSLKRKGIEIVTSAQVTAITAGGVECSVKGKPKSYNASLVLTAVGRTPAIPSGAIEAGITFTERGAIATDENMQTSIPGVFAIGDVNGRCMLAHAATAQGKVVLGEKVDLTVVPAAVFTNPECAMAGYTEKQCADLGLTFRTGKATFRSNGKAIAMDEPEGLVKIIVGDNGRLLGCHICGAHAADLVQEAAVIMSAGLGADTLAGVIHGHPTLGETVVSAFRNLA